MFTLNRLLKWIPYLAVALLIFLAVRYHLKVDREYFAERNYLHEEYAKLYCKYQFEHRLPEVSGNPDFCSIEFSDIYEGQFRLNLDGENSIFLVTYVFPKAPGPRPIQYVSLDFKTSPEFLIEGRGEAIGYDEVARIIKGE